MKVYVPRKSYGWLFLALLVFPLLFSGFLLVHVYSATGKPVLLIFGIPFLVILFSLRTMRYELDDEDLVMKCSFLKYIVPFSSIKRITKRDLEISLWSSLRLPGLALFTVPYADIGKVKMCATSASKGIILIETEGGVYGITPLDEDTFVADLKSRLRD